MAEETKQKGPKFTEPTPKLPKPVERRQNNNFPEFRKNAKGETVMSYRVFSGISRDNIEKMLEGQEKAQQRARGQRMKRIKS